MLKMLAVGGVLASVLVAPMSAQAAKPITIPVSAPAPNQMTIDVATVNGSGCRAGTAAVALSADNTAFTVSYSDYLAQTGAGTKPTDARKNCQLSLRINVPHGITYAIARADYRGYASLAKGARGMQKSSYYFQGMPSTTTASTTFRGPYDDSWQVSDVTEVGALVFAPCGAKRNFNINTELRLKAGTSRPNTTSYMSVDSIDGSLNTVYHFAWKYC